MTEYHVTIGNYLSGICNHVAQSRHGIPLTRVSQEVQYRKGDATPATEIWKGGVGDTTE